MYGFNDFDKLVEIYLKSVFYVHEGKEKPCTSRRSSERINKGLIDWFKKTEKKKKHF